jgi:hypothetical protein
MKGIGASFNFNPVMKDLNAPHYASILFRLPEELYSSHSLSNICSIWILHFLLPHPNTHLQMFGYQHIVLHFLDDYVLSLCNTILLWCISQSKLLVDVMNFTKVLKLS